MTTRNPPAADTPARLPLPARFSLALGTGTILQGLNSAIVAVALIPIALHFGTSAAIPWIVSGLYIASAVGSPAAGRLSDLFGPRRIYLIGLAVVLLASVAGPFVPSVEWLVVDRIVLGLGASMHFPAAMAIIRQQAAKREQTATGAIGIIAICGQTSAALGPTIGGLVVVIWGWEGIFWVNVPLVIASAIWVLTQVPADEARKRSGVLAGIRSIDPLGMGLFVATVVLLMLGLLSLEGDPQWLLFAAFVPVAALFVLRELRTPSPFIDVRLMLTHRQFALTCARAILTFISFYCIFYGLPQWLEASRGLDAAATGLLMLPVFGVGVASTILATRLGRRLKPRLLLVFGTTAMVVAGALLALVTSTDSPIWLLVVISVLLGIPNGFNNLGNQLILHSSVPGANAGSASGIYRTSQYFGAVLSAVIVAHVVGVGEAEGGIRTLGVVIGGLGGLMLVTNLVALYRGRGKSMVEL
ncbi:MFS family permease [Conyzicola lurida]|uniref:MFS family permease n=1 Tax=Conyzicola lurida TaxID=1172621 RepID=A0A841AQL1_9MICO|nr:MFS transporter [Conyzicola lurida]MBB5844578.1 MFS family permease [Conyzicola lurida]